MRIRSLRREPRWADDGALEAVEADVDVAEGGKEERMVDADVIVMATPVYFYTISAQMKTLIDRCCGRYTEMNGKEFYFIVTAAEDDRKKMLRTIDTFQGFLDCLEDPVIKGTVFGLGVWHKGEINGNPAMKDAYQMGKQV